MSEKLTPLERAVIALSRQDPVSSLRSGSRKRGWILGLPTAPPPLANPRLEALRRYAILRRLHGQDRVEAEREQLGKMDFSDEQIEEVGDLVDPGSLTAISPDRRKYLRLGRRPFSGTFLELSRNK